MQPGTVTVRGRKTGRVRNISAEVFAEMQKRGTDAELIVVARSETPAGIPESPTYRDLIAAGTEAQEGGRIAEALASFEKADGLRSTAANRARIESLRSELSGSGEITLD